MSYKMSKITNWLFIMSASIILVVRDVSACDDVNCATCPSSPSVCQSCNGIYGATPSGTCIPCSPPNCAWCWGDYTYCVGCITGYGLLSGYGSSCESCANPNCRSCTQDVNICVSCHDGYGLIFVSGSGNCVICSDT